MKKIRFISIIVLAICLICLLTACNYDYSNNLKTKGYTVISRAMTDDDLSFGNTDEDKQGVAWLLFILLTDMDTDNITRITYAYNSDKTEAIVIVSFSSSSAASKSYNAKKRNGFNTNGKVFKKHGSSIYFGTQQAYNDAT